ncbi:MAG TPA: TlyA family RNA methyltransferase [Propionicimonas sp.]|nr:TlyA family RNA methyltransferase [Propionicimonas sp.]
MSSRLDRELVVRGLARSRQQARELIDTGKVLLNSQPATKAAALVEAADVLTVTDPDPYVSRAAHKLRAALVASGIAVPNRVLDAGASTGGFTQVLLEAGARRVYAVDVGHDQLVAQLRCDPRVAVREGLNLRQLAIADIEDEPVDLVVADVSFISIRLLLQPLFSVLTDGGSALLLVKPQFEVGRGHLDDRGVVRDDRRRRDAVDAVIADAAALGWSAHWQAESRLPGESGNVEFFVAFSRSAAPRGPVAAIPPS